MKSLINELIAMALYNSITPTYEGFEEIKGSEFYKAFEEFKGA